MSLIILPAAIAESERASILCQTSFSPLKTSLRLLYDLPQL